LHQNLQDEGSEDGFGTEDFAAETKQDAAKSVAISLKRLVAEMRAET
jgi:hypothetical protein